MEDDIRQAIKLMQASFHEQIGTLKADAESARADAEAVLQLAAEFETKMQKVMTEQERVQKIAEAVKDILQRTNALALENHRNKTRLESSVLCLGFIEAALLLIIKASRDLNSLRERTQSLHDILKLQADFDKRFLAATNFDEIASLVDQFNEEYLRVAGEVLIKM